MNARLLWIVGMVGSVAGALAGNELPEPWNHYVMTVSAICAAITGYNVTHPPPPREAWTDEERNAHREAQALPAAPPPTMSR